MTKKIPSFPAVLLLFVALGTAVACKSDRQRLDETLAAATRAVSESQASTGSEPAPADRQLDIQKSAFTNPVKHVPTQEELIREHHVRTVKETYDDGFNLSTYDRAGQKIAEENDFSGKKTLTYTLTKTGKPSEIKTKFSDGTSMVTRTVYDARDRVRSETRILSEGDTVTKEYQYDDILNTRTEIHSTGREKEFYDNRGLRVRFESYDTDGKMVGYGEAEYDAAGLKLREDASVMGIRILDKFTYNAQGQVIRLERAGMVDVVITSEYDSKGLLTRQWSSAPSGINSSYTYTFH